MTVLDALLEGFNPGEARDFHGRWLRTVAAVEKLGAGDSHRVSGSFSVTRVAPSGDRQYRVTMKTNGRIGDKHVYAGTAQDAAHAALGRRPAPAAAPTYRERRAARADRLRGWADKREARGRSGYEQGRASVDQIPLGEPIHGRSDARRRERAFAKVERSFADQTKAESMRSRADEIQRQASHAIYSDDPNAPEALRAKVSTLEAQRVRIKRYNTSARAAAKKGGVGDASILDPSQRQELESLRKIGRFGMGPGDSLPKYMLTNLGGNISRAKKRLAQFERAQESSLVLDALLEGFTEQLHPRGWHGRFTVGDRVRVALKNGGGIEGKVLRPSEALPDSHVVIAPEGGGPHVLAHVNRVRLNTPEQHHAEKRRQEIETLKRGASAGEAATGRGQRGIGARGMRSLQRMRAMPTLADEPAGVGLLLEGFNVPPPSPSETPAQSMALGAQQTAQAKAEIASGRWNPSKHPRAQGGRFGYTTGGKRAKRGSKSSSRTLGVGASGPLVRSIQQQLGIPADGIYGQQTRQAVARYQQQHGLQVDGVVGRQTLAALRGHAHPQSITPGKIASKNAVVKPHPLAGSKAKAGGGKKPTPAAKPKASAPAPVRMSGGIVV